MDEAFRASQVRAFLLRVGIVCARVVSVSGFFLNAYYFVAAFEENLQC